MTQSIEKMKQKMTTRLNRLSEKIVDAKAYDECGVVVKITGITIEVTGLALSIGTVCKIHLSKGQYAEGEVIGFSKDSIFIMPYEHVRGIAKGTMVSAVLGGGMAKIGRGLLGRIVDSLGNPIDNRGAIEDVELYPLHPKPLNPLSRERISQPLDVGVRAINTLITTCKGQRMGIFAESGIGKSVLLGMMTKFAEADIVVVGLIGERGREVKEFIEEIIGSEGLKKSIIIAAPADTSPLMKVAGATYATSVAEYFRDKGHNVLLIIDSLTRYAQSFREMSVSGGELPTSKGYTPTVFSRLSQLVERSGNGLNKEGSITAFYTLLIEGEEILDPVAEHVRSLIDGHIILSRQLAESGHYPAIDIERSVSRLMHSVVNSQHHQSAMLIKKVVSAYHRNQDMINIGMYQHGSDRYVDMAIQHWKAIEAFLTQQMNERAEMPESLSKLEELVISLRGHP